MKACLVFLLLLIVFQVTGQDQNLRGIVLDDQGSPLKGVNILLLGNKTIGTSSGTDGGFSLLCRPGDTLIFSHIGYEFRKIAVQGEHFTESSRAFTVHLIPRFIALEQVIISEKRDRSFRYLLDFEVVQGYILKLEIKGRNKILILSDINDTDYWRCLLPEYAGSCTKLDRDFADNVYLQSEDSLYQLYISVRTCQLLPGIHQGRHHLIMDQCIGQTSNGILLRYFGEYNKSVSLWLAMRNGRKKIYEQNDDMALRYCLDLAGKETYHAGLGFQVTSPEMASSPSASLYRQHIPRGAQQAFNLKIMAKPISVESFCINDSIFVFDNTVNRMFIFNQLGEQLGSNSIEFNNRDFLQKYITDDRTKLSYGVFRNKKGVYLQVIDRKTGKTDLPAKWIDMYFPEKVRIFDNIAFYLKYNHSENTRRIIKTNL